jgi:hypothetical protein
LNFAYFDRLCKLEKRGDEISFWLKIEQFWPFEEISILSNGGHLGYRTALTDTILKGDHPRILSAKFGMCPVIPTSNQDGRQAKNRKKGGWN